MLTLFSKKSTAKNWGRSVLNLIVALSLVLMTFGVSGTTVAMAGRKVELKADPRLLKMAADHPDNTFKIIVQQDTKNKDKNVDDPQQAVRNGRGRIKKQMNLITSFSADLTGREIIKLAKNKKVHWISADVPMFSTSIPNSTVLLKAPTTENILDTSSVTAVIFVFVVISLLRHSVSVADEAAERSTVRELSLIHI